MICKACGREIGEKTNFCKYCGTPISTSVNESSGKEKNKKQKKEKSGKLGKIIIFITIIVLLLLAVIVYYFAKQKGVFERDDVETTVSTSSETEETKDGIEFTSESADTGNVSATPSAVGVEEQVLIIREQYNNIVENIDSDAYDKKSICNGASAYFENNIVRAIVIPQNTDGNEYSKSYYYDEHGDILFSYYEAGDANRMYFYDSQLIRWRFSSDASDAQNAENHDCEDSSEYDGWQKTVLQDSEYYLGIANSEDANSDDVANDTANDDYVWPGSDSRYMDKSDLKGFSKKDCLLARNELYARHGRRFDDKELQAYFDSKDWYNGTIDPDVFSESMLNKYEIHNRNLIVKFEKEKGYR